MSYMVGGAPVIPFGSTSSTNAGSSSGGPGFFSNNSQVNPNVPGNTAQQNQLYNFLTGQIYGGPGVGTSTSAYNTGVNSITNMLNGGMVASPAQQTNLLNAANSGIQAGVGNLNQQFQNTLENIRNMLTSRGMENSTLSSYEGSKAGQGYMTDVGNLINTIMSNYSQNLVQAPYQTANVANILAALGLQGSNTSTNQALNFGGLLQQPQLAGKSTSTTNNPSMFSDIANAGTALLGSGGGGGGGGSGGLLGGLGSIASSIGSLFGL